MILPRLLAFAALSVAMLAAAEAQTPKPAERQAEPLVSTISLADIGLPGGFRLANLGGRQELFVPLPQGLGVTARELVLTFDDVTAYDSRRSLEILLNDRSTAAIALDGRGNGRIVRVPLANAPARDGFLKLTFLYSGAATQDRCMDVRYVGDSVTIRPETAIEIELPANSPFDVSGLAGLMPRDVAVVLPGRRLSSSETASALMIARALKSSGRRVAFQDGFRLLPELARRSELRRWTRGLVLIGNIAEASTFLDAPLATLAGATPPFGTINVVRVAGLPALLVTETDSAQAARLFGSPSLAATRGNTAAFVGDVAPRKQSTDRISLDDLGVIPPQADVFGRADLSFSLPARSLPAGTKLSRIVLDVMVAPDGAGENAVVTVFVNERLLGSKVAAVGEPTHLDLAVDDGLVGAVANVRTVVQRRSAQGDCRFEPQGYPAQILGSSLAILDPAGTAHDFAELAPRWSRRTEVMLSGPAAERPVAALGLLASILSGLSADMSPITVTFAESAIAPAPSSAFIAVSDTPPAGSEPRVRFDRGRVAVADRAGRNVLELGGYSAGAVAQIVQSGGHPGLWIKPLASDRVLPTPPDPRLDRGDIAFIDNTGVALAMSSERDKVVRIAYLDRLSWAALGERYRSWIMGGLWLCATIAFLFALQRMVRRSPARGE